MSNVINVLYVLVAVIGAIYVAPFLIALIASGGVIQLLIAILFVYLLFKIAQNANTLNLDRD